ncbi:MAG: site-specific integrase [Lachnospiraceae bacterium]|nr:site-specific integrase [Lachnospiraceae bacterium]
MDEFTLLSKNFNLNIKDLANYGIIDTETVRNFEMQVFESKLKEIYEKEGVKYSEPNYFEDIQSYRMRIPKKLQDKYDLKVKYSARDKAELIKKVYLLLSGELTKLKTLNQVYTEWLLYAYEKQNQKNRSKHTVDEHKMAYEKWIISQPFGELMIKDITVQSYINFWDTLSGKISSSAKVELKTTLNQIWDYAQIQGYVEQNTSRLVEKVDIDVIPKAFKVPKSPEDREKLIEYYLGLDTVYGYFLALMECLPCRVGEVKAFKWSDVYLDEAQPFIVVSHEITDDGLYVAHTKAKKSACNHTVSLSPRAITILKIVKEKYIFKDNFIFLGKNDNFLITCELNKNIKKACKELGIKKNLSTHDCRRYSATQCAIKGMSEPALQVMHGWTDRDTARHYINSAAAKGEQADIMINVLN